MHNKSGFWTSGRHRDFQFELSENRTSPVFGVLLSSIKRSIPWDGNTKKMLPVGTVGSDI